MHNLSRGWQINPRSDTFFGSGPKEGQFFPQGGPPENPRVQSASGVTESEGSFAYDPVFY